MPRQPKPFIWRGFYCTDRGGKRVKLCPITDGIDAANAALAALTGSSGVGLTVAGAVELYLAHCTSYYGPADHNDTAWAEVAFRDLVAVAGLLPAASLSRNHLRMARERMVRAGVSRRYVNAKVGRIKRGIRWLAEHGHVPDAVAVAVGLLRPLPAGRSPAPELEPVGPVSWEHVRATVERLPEIWADMVRLQWVTGLRPGEVCGLRLEEVLTPRPDEMTIDFGRRHKNAWRGKARVVPVGAAGQAILRPWLYRAAIGGRQTVFTNWRRRSDAPPSTESYATIVARAAKRAGVPRWSPNQLRHSYATRVRAALGLEAAQVALGHARADVTQIYAERDGELAARVARLLG